jgi:hypothetical protein
MFQEETRTAKNLTIPFGVMTNKHLIVVTGNLAMPNCQTAKTSWQALVSQLLVEIL